MAYALVALLSALAELFGVMFIGFLAFRLRFLSAPDMKGIGFLLGRVALPTMVFSVCATVNFETFDVGVVVTAILVRLFLIVVCFFVGFTGGHGSERWMSAAAASNSIVSNDVAFGIPLIAALYPPGNRYLASLLGIVATWSVLTPVIVLTWEYAAAKRDEVEQQQHEELAMEITHALPAPAGSTTAIAGDSPVIEVGEPPAATVGVESAEGAIQMPGEVWPSLLVSCSTHSITQTPNVGATHQSFCVKVLKNMLRNPVLLSTFIGLCYRFALVRTLTKTRAGYQLPPGLNEISNTIKAAFNFLVLFCLGESAEHNLALLRRPGALRMPLFLCFMKLMVAPVLLHALVGTLSDRSGTNLRELREFVVMYGLIPTSEAGLVWARAYKHSTADSACTVLLTTFFCGPLIFFANVYLQGFSTEQFSSALRTMNLSLGSLSLAMSVWVLLSFMRMGHRWLSFPITLHLALATALCVYCTTGLVVYATDSGSMCLSLELSARVVYALRQAARLAVDLLITIMALCVGVFRRFGLATARRMGSWLIAGALLLPIGLYGVLGASQTPTTPQMPCFEVLLAERWLDPALRGMCLVVTVSAALAGLQISRSDNDHALMQRFGLPATAAPGQPIYALSALASCTWLVQLTGTFFGGRLEDRALFLEFVGAGLYMFFAPTQCLLLTLRGECLQRWRELFVQLCVCWR